MAPPLIITRQLWCCPRADFKTSLCGILMYNSTGIRLRQGKMRIPEGYFLLIFLLVLLNLDRLKVLLDLPRGSFRGKGNYHDTDG